MCGEAVCNYQDTGANAESDFQSYNVPDVTPSIRVQGFPVVIQRAKEVCTTEGRQTSQASALYNADVAKDVTSRQGRPIKEEPLYANRNELISTRQWGNSYRCKVRSQYRLSELIPFKEDSFGQTSKEVRDVQEVTCRLQESIPVTKANARGLIQL